MPCSFLASPGTTTVNTLAVDPTEFPYLIHLASGDAYTPSAAPLTVAAAPITAVATAVDTILVTLPVTSVLSNTDPTAVSLALGADTLTVLGIGSETPKAIQSIALPTDGSKILTVKLTSPYTVGDVLNYNPDATAFVLRSGTNVTAPPYTRRPTPIPVLPSVQSATLVGPRQVLVRLPLPCTLFSPSGANVTSLTGPACGDILEVQAASNATLTKALADTPDACSMTSPTTLLVTLAADVSSGDVIAIKQTVTSTGHTLRAGDSPAAPTIAAGPANTPIRPALLSATAAFQKADILVQLPVPSTFVVSSTTTRGLTRDQCAAVFNVNVRQPAGPDSPPPCRLSADGLTVLLEVNSILGGGKPRCKQHVFALLSSRATYAKCCMPCRALALGKPRPADPSSNVTDHASSPAPSSFPLPHRPLTHRPRHPQRLRPAAAPGDGQHDFRHALRP